MKLTDIRKKGKTPKRQERHCYGDPLREIAPYVTSLFMKYSINPTVASILAIVLGLFGSLMFLTGNTFWIIIGLIIHHISYLFDIIDGQVARLQKKSNVSGAYLDAVNHYFNIPLIFICLALGRFLDTGNVLLVLAAISLSIFSRGSARYCIASSILTTITRLRIKESDPLYISVENKKTDIRNARTLRWIRSLLTYPNILGILFLLTLFDIAGVYLLWWNSFHLVKLAIYAYSILYPVLDISNVVFGYVKRTPDVEYTNLLTYGRNKHESKSKRSN